jgi:hypothetical protein
MAKVLSYDMADENVCCCQPLVPQWEAVFQYVSGGMGVRVGRGVQVCFNGVVFTMCSYIPRSAWVGDFGHLQFYLVFFSGPL